MAMGRLQKIVPYLLAFSLVSCTDPQPTPPARVNRQESSAAEIASTQQVAILREDRGNSPAIWQSEFMSLMSRIDHLDAVQYETVAEIGSELESMLDSPISERPIFDFQRRRLIQNKALFDARAENHRAYREIGQAITPFFRENQDLLIQLISNESIPSAYVTQGPNGLEIEVINSSPAQDRIRTIRTLREKLYEGNATEQEVTSLCEHLYQAGDAMMYSSMKLPAPEEYDLSPEEQQVEGQFRNALDDLEKIAEELGLPPRRNEESDLPQDIYRIINEEVISTRSTDFSNVTRDDRNNLTLKAACFDILYESLVLSCGRYLQESGNPRRVTLHGHSVRSAPNSDDRHIGLSEGLNSAFGRGNQSCAGIVLYKQGSQVVIQGYNFGTVDNLGTIDLR